MARMSSVCRHFLQGKCERGDACSFSHDAVQPLTSVMSQPANVGVCRHFLQGRCERGNQCSFSHDAILDFSSAQRQPQYQESLPPAEYQQGGLYGLPPMAYQLPPAEPIQNVHRAYQAAAPVANGGRFSQPQHQPDLLAALFAPQADLLAALMASNPGQDPQLLAALLVQQQQQQQPVYQPPLASSSNICRHFLVGKCDVGENCRFSHDGQPQYQLPGAQFNQNLPLPPPLASSSKMCRHFAAGKCLVEHCRFSHGDGTPAGMYPLSYPTPQREDTRSAQVGLCRHFLAGKCERGAECNFSHGDAAKEEVPERVCRHFLVGRCDRGAKCIFSHGETKKENALTEGVCRDFRQGNCRKGNACRYAHDMDVTPTLEDMLAAVGFEGNEEEIFQAAIAADGKEDLKKGVCRHYLIGKCNYGDKCGYRHPAGMEGSIAQQVTVSEQPSAGGTTPGLCRHFLQSRCEYGASCRFLHDDQARAEWKGQSDYGKGVGRVKLPSELRAAPY